MSFEDIFYFSSGSHMFLAEQNGLYNFGRRRYKEHFCELILNLGQWLRKKCRLKIFLLLAPVAILFNGAAAGVSFRERAL